jgi:hypothetical protein
VLLKKGNEKQLNSNMNSTNENIEFYFENSSIIEHSMMKFEEA